MVHSSKSIRLTDLNQLPPADDRTMFTIQCDATSQLPIEKNPIRFAILYRNWCTSNAWGVRVERKGDAYIYCRDNLQAQHVSLHASGKQHITIDPNSPSAGDLSEKLFTNQWQEPDEGIPTFRLVFPSWGTQLNAEQQNRFKSKWKKNDIYIEGHHEFLTIVAFYIVREQVKLQKKGTFPGFVLGELPLACERKLVITAEWEPERDFQSVIKRALKRVPLIENLPNDERGEGLVMCMTGTNSSTNSVFMVNFPVVNPNRAQVQP